MGVYAYAKNNPSNFTDPYGYAVGDWWDYSANTERATEIANELLRQHQGHNDIDDARRHSEWSRRMAEELGTGWAEIIGTGHEIDGLINGSPLDETLMDLNNNAEGRDASESGRPVNEDNLEILEPDSGEYEYDRDRLSPDEADQDDGIYDPDEYFDGEESGKEK